MPYRNYFPHPLDFNKITNLNQAKKMYHEGWLMYQQLLGNLAPIAWECKWFLEGESEQIGLSKEEMKKLAKYAMSDKYGPWIPSREGKIYKSKKKKNEEIK